MEDVNKDEQVTVKDEYQCPKCSRRFNNIGFFKCHFYRVHPEFRLTTFLTAPQDAKKAPEPKSEPKIPVLRKKCEKCKKFFNTAKEHDEHPCGEFTGNTLFKCDKCSKLFMKKSNLLTHVYKVHTDPKGNELPKEEMDENGMAVETDVPKRTFRCPLCGKTFAQKMNLRSHALTHANDNQYKCEQCDKNFTSKSQLKSHMLIHTKVKSHVCETCNETFATKAALKIHSQTHATDNPYVCDICNEAFSDSPTLKSHYITHEEVNPFACTLCDKRFSRQVLLKRHLTLHEKANESGNEEVED